MNRALKKFGSIILKTNSGPLKKNKDDAFKKSKAQQIRQTNICKHVQHKIQFLALIHIQF